MRNRRAPAVLIFRATRQAVVMALLGLVAIVVGFIAPLSAHAGVDHGGSEKPWICHPVEGAGETGFGWNLIDPDKASSHIDEETGAGFHTRKDGRTDVYAVRVGGVWVCPGRVPTTTTTTIGPSTTTTTGTTTGPTTTTTGPTTTSQPVVTTPAETPGTGATLVPTTEEPGSAATILPETAPQMGAVTENVVPRAATDGADLATGWSPVQSALVGSGFLLLAAAGRISVRRRVEGLPR